MLEDVEDHILLKAFKSGVGMLNVEGIHKRIQKDQHEKRERAAMQLAQTVDKKDAEEDKSDDPFELGAAEDKKRKFAVQYRPHEKIWNFVQEDPNDRLPHLLRATADPSKAYIDTRVSDLLELTEGMGQHLSMHNADMWAHINKMTM